MSAEARGSLLVISGVSPWPMRGGFSLRMAHLIRELAIDWNVTVISPSTADRSEAGCPPSVEWQPVTIRSRWSSLPPTRTDRAHLGTVVEQQLGRRRPDVVLLGPGVEFLAFDRPDFPPTVADRIDCTTLERFRGIRRSVRALWRLAPTAWYERRLVRTLATIVVAGEDDARALARLGGEATSIAIVPNGVEVEPDPRFDREDPVPTVVFTGTLDYPPNVDAVEYFASAIWPSIRRSHPTARFLVAGRTPSANVRRLTSIPGIDLRENVPDMVRILQTGWVAVAPMRIGTGVKNKVLEAWGAGRPVVLTPRATNGLLLDGPMVDWIAATPERFSAAVTELLGDRVRRHEVGGAALDAVRDRHSWVEAARQMSRLLRLARGRGVRT